ncbi:MAG: glycosyltransferase family 2 protein [Paenibacillus lautus]|jgi:glycosyltransferase involved in cell wall biosynthesis|uniref:glycosyltransferase family 2 protein n=1 Tax=Paenibacillus lautus TaxID=1401 RepID=UPI0026F34141|nr:glycosyltransferase family 2 protein [Paenibacillus lautus]MCI1778013.1 glycosyltransferase family 2 protein [Paenibacillus lautus]
MKKVQVLLSAYNGEQYISEQIQSILHQTHAAVSILIRDDGSTDKTMELLDQWVTTHPDQIKLIKGTNVGVVSSFFELLRAADAEADYYCFCDQDDVWLDHKVEHAIARLDSSIYTEVPAMVFTSTYLTDDKLNRKGAWPKPPAQEPSFFNALYENIAIGATITMNRSARNLFINSQSVDSQKVLMHDWWFYLLVSAFGTVIYDNKPSMLYRQHNNNVVGGSNSIVGKLKSKWASFKRHTGKDLLHKQASEFDRIYGSRLTGEQKEQLDLFLATRTRFMDRLRYARKSKLYRQSKAEGLLFKFLILIGFI